MSNKQSLTIGEIEEIINSLGDKSWNTFKKMSPQKRLKFGKLILKKFNKEGAIDALLKIIREKRAEFKFEPETNKGE